MASNRVLIFLVTCVVLISVGQSLVVQTRHHLVGIEPMNNETKNASNADFYNDSFTLLPGKSECVCRRNRWIFLNRLVYHSITGVMICVPFLCATLLVYAALPEMHTVHGKSVMCNLVSLTAAYSLLIYLHLDRRIDLWWCRPMGYAMYFGFLSKFMWVNVISFDVWWTFR